MGTAKKSHDFMDDHKTALANRLYELKTNPEKIKDIDLDHDGKISEEEWAAAKVKIEKELLEKGLEQGHSEPADVIIAKGESEKLFMITDSSEKQLIEQLAFETKLCIFGGAALSAYTLWSFINYMTTYY
jgi:hypothetical protein